MRRVLALAAIGFASFMLGGCAGESGYNLDLRNTSSEVVKLELIAQGKHDEPVVVESSKIEGGGHKKMFTKAKRDALVQLAARVEGDTISDPALKRLTLGETFLTIHPAPSRQDQPPKAPKLVIRERSSIE